MTNANGHYSLTVPSLQDTLRFSFIGFQTKTIPINGRTTINVSMKSTVVSGQQLVVVGYGKQEKKAITGAISTVTSEQLDEINAGTSVSNILAGQISGLSFRKAEGRPGSGASIQIRNMGTPLIVIDGVVKSMTAFNNLAASDIKSITVLKGAQAAIYGSRGANGVVVVTTKHGSYSSEVDIGIDFHYGWQNLTTYANNVLASAWKWKRYAAEAQINTTGHTSITPEEIQKWKHPEKQKYPVKWRSFDWPAYIFHKNAPQYSFHAYASGGSDKVKYYVSVTHMKQNAVFKQYFYKRTNVQANITARLGQNFEVGITSSGRVEERIHPGIPGVDDYWQPLFASMRNTPMIHPFANFNPKYLSDIGHTETNAGLWTYENSGTFTQIKRGLDVYLHATWDVPFVKGLSIKGRYSYSFNHLREHNHEQVYKAYTYFPATQTYKVTGGSTNPWQHRIYGDELDYGTTVQINYERSFGDHNIDILVGTQWTYGTHRRQKIHDVPVSKYLNIVVPKTIDNTAYIDYIHRSARIGNFARVSYNYKQKYYLQFAGRYDASWKFPPGKRWGFFPSVSAGWRIIEEPFFQSFIGENSVLTNLKIRASYGILGDEGIIAYGNAIGVFAYIPGYSYRSGTYIFEGNAIVTSASRGVPITNISWITAKTFDAGIDFGFWNGRLTGSIDYFQRKRTGLLGNAYRAVIPALLGYALPQRNQNSDLTLGGEFSVNYQSSNTTTFTYAIGFNIGYARTKFLHSVDPTFGNSWDRYRHSMEERWEGIFWGYQVIGRFQSYEQINNYPVNIDGQGNTTLLPGDFIYKDVNGDGVINGYDMRPIGGAGGGFQPMWYGGLQLSFGWRGFDLQANFSFAGRYWFNRNYEARWPFQNNGNLLKPYLDRWHLKNYRDPNSGWVPGKYPPLRFNASYHSNYNKNSTFWLVNVRYFRLRTLALGYTLPEKWISNLGISKLRVFINTYNLFSIDTMPSFIDPAAASSNGLQYPQNQYVNVGINLVF